MIGSTWPGGRGGVAYTYAIFGELPSFVVAWMLALAYTSVLSFEAISVGWVVGTLVPGIEGPILYSSLGESVRLGSLLLGLVGMGILTYFNYRGARSAARVQDILTYCFIAVVLIFISVGIIWGDATNLQPLFRVTGSGKWSGILAVFVTTPVWYAGFVVIPQVMEEKAVNTAPHAVAKGILLSIVIAGLFYCLVVVAASMAQPWQQILDLDMPAAAAFESAFNSPALGKVVLFSGLLGLVTTWNTFFLSAARVLFALGRAKLIAPALGTVHPRFGSPAPAVLFCAVVGTAGAFLGRNAIVLIINLVGTIFAVAFISTCLGLLTLRFKQPDRRRPYRVPGGKITAAVAVLASIGMLGLTIYQPYLSAGRSFPLEWGILLGWAALGTVFWIAARPLRNSVSSEERRNLILSE